MSATGYRMTRRKIVIGAAASLICAPAIVRAASLMPVRGLPLPFLNPERKRHQPADTTAQIFWSKNRRPDLWRDVKKIDSEPEMVKQTYSGEALLARLKERGFVELEGEYTIVDGQDKSHPVPTPS